jgi:hypothetical protein
MYVCRTCCAILLIHELRIINSSFWFVVLDRRVYSRKRRANAVAVVVRIQKQQLSVTPTIIERSLVNLLLCQLFVEQFTPDQKDIINAGTIKTMLICWIVRMKLGWQRDVCVKENLNDWYVDD